MKRWTGCRTLVLALALTAPAAAEEGRPAAASPLDLNRASRQELETLPGIGPVRAEQIIRMRERNGGFRCVEELRALPRLSDRQFDAVKNLVVVEGPQKREDCAQPQRRRKTQRAP